ncbi:MAG TPA: DUF2130 domain-containing protein [Steroidobacteraceae bacterium]|nr:DUF2130 domain-containing protein [Steroidobacteraceae bacterium]
MNPSTAKFLLAPDIRITCPHCSNEFALADGFARKALESVEQASATGLAMLREQERANTERQAQQIAAERDAAHARALAEVRSLSAQAFMPQIEALKVQLAESQARVAALDQREQGINARERTIEARIAEGAALRAAALVAGERQEYQQRLLEQSARLQALQSEQVALREERQQLIDQRAAMALEVQRQVDARVAERDVLVRSQEQQRSALEKAELQKKIDDMAGKLSEAQAKASQGSQQLQGEVLELAIEEALRRAFPLDTIEEVKKGQRGGDVLQHVVTRTGQSAGTILWETKRAKDWSPQWIAKLKEDMRASSAALGILVTMPGALPRDWSGDVLFAPYEDVWVTQAATATGLAEALRAGLIDLHRQRAVSAGKGEKMEALYDYLTSAQFAHKLRAVYDMFRKMREELESEKSVTQQRWARRERQLQAGVTQLLGIGGEIQGLAQQELPMLELEPGGPPP